MKFNLFQFSYLTLAGAFMLLVSGCAGAISQDSTLEKNWGRSYETQLHLQTANPDAGANKAQVTVMEGNVSDQVMENYRRSLGPEKKDQTVSIIKLK